LRHLPSEIVEKGSLGRAAEQHKTVPVAANAFWAAKAALSIAPTIAKWAHTHKHANYELPT
jgi:hypothetical protein